MIPQQHDAGYRPALTPARTGTRIALHVVPGARSVGLAGMHGAAVKLRVSAPPADGRANDEVLHRLAGILGVQPGEITLVGGHRSRSKVVLVGGLSVAEVADRLAEAPLHSPTR
jgi:uncharacterized protein